MTLLCDQLLQDLACNDRTLDDPEIQANLAAKPNWRHELEEVLSLRDRLGRLGRVSPTLQAEALGLRRPEDAMRVHRAFRARRRLPRLALAALLLLPTLPLALLLPGGAVPAAATTMPDGKLGTTAGLQLDSTKALWQLHCAAPLPPGSSHRVVMVAVDGQMLEASPDAFPWQLPAEWQQLARQAGAAQFELSSCEPGGVPQQFTLHWSAR